jgi:uncharacterized Zn finger protein (UPF0148 family)
MKYVAPVCPNCGASLNVTTYGPMMFCPFCGSRIVNADLKQTEHRREVRVYNVNEDAIAKAEAEKAKAEAAKAQAEAEKAKAEARKAEAEADKVRAEADIARSEAKKAEADAKVKKTKLITRLVIAALATVFLLVLVGVGEGWF